MEAELVPASILETAHRQNGRRILLMAVLTPDQADMVATLTKMLGMYGWYPIGNEAKWKEHVWEKLVLDHPRHMIGEVVMVARCDYSAGKLGYELKAVEISNMGLEAIGPKGDVSQLEVFSMPVVLVDGSHKEVMVAGFDELVESEGDWQIIAVQRTPAPASPTTLLLFLLFMRLSFPAPASVRRTSRSIFCSRRLSHIQIFGLIYWMYIFCFLAYVSKQ